MRQFGMVLSMGISLFLFTFFIGAVEIGVEQSSGFLNAQKYAFLIYALLCMAGVLISLARGRTG